MTASSTSLERFDCLTRLPQEVLDHILSNLNDPSDLHNFSLTCKRLRFAGTQDAFWEPIYLDWWSSLSDHGQDCPSRQRRRKDKLRQLVLTEERCISSNSGVSTSGATLVEEPQGSALYSIDRLLSSPQHSTQEHGDRTPFHRICCERLNIEDHFLRRAQHHVTLSYGHLISALDIAHTMGNSIKDLLHILIWDQQLPSESSETERCELQKRLSNQETDERWPKARHLHLRAMSGSPRPHAQYHLALYEFAQSLLGYLQRRDAVSSFRQLSQQSRESDLGRQREESVNQDPRHDTRTLREQCREGSLQAEEALIAMSQFRGVDKVQVVEYLDLLAVYIYMKLRGHSQPILTTKDVVKAILHHLQALSFDVAGPLAFLTLDNSFLHVSLFCPHNRATLPLTLNVIFASVASRLGLSVGVSNIPGRIISVVLDTTSSSCEGAVSEDDLIFFVDGTDDSPIREPDDVVSWARMIGKAEGTTFRSLDWEPTSGASLLSRSAQNMLNAIRNWVGPDLWGQDQDSTGPSHSQRDDSSNVASSSPGPSSWLHRYLANHPATYHQDASMDQLPAFIRPLRRQSAHALPTNRRQCLQTHIVTQATYAAMWALNETRHLAMASMSADWILRYMGDQEILDVGLTSHGEKAYAKQAGMQRRIAVARSRQGQIGIHGYDGASDTQKEEDVIPVWAFRSHDDANDDIDEDDGESSDDSDAVQDSTTINTSFRIPYASHTDGLTAYKVMIPQLISRSLDIPDPRSARPPKVKHSIGTLFQHRMHNYKAVITDWAPECQADAAWIQTMNVDALPEGGRNQPFYQSTVEDGSTRYVAQCNIQPASESCSSDETVFQQYRKLLAVPGLGKVFRCLDLNLRRLRTLPVAGAVEVDSGGDINGGGDS